MAADLSQTCRPEIDIMKGRWLHRGGRTAGAATEHTRRWTGTPTQVVMMREEGLAGAPSKLFNVAAQILAR